MDNKTNNTCFNSYLIRSFTPREKQSNIIGNGRICHYTDPGAFLSIIQSHSLRFTDIRFLNDKSESIYFVKVLVDFIEHNGGKYPIFEKVAMELFKNNDIQHLKKLDVSTVKYSDIPNLPFDVGRTFVFCSCQNKDSLNMWNYYVNNGNYQGYNIVFKINELLKSFDTPAPDEIDAFSVIYGKVLYKPRDQYGEVELLANDIEKNYMSYMKNSKITEDKALAYTQIELLSYITTYGVFYKHPKFQSEEEYRIAIHISDERIPRQKKDAKNYFGEYNQDMIEGFCTKKGLIVPYLNVAFSNKAIKGITLAPMAEHGIARAGVRELLKTEKFENVVIYKSDIPIRF